MRDFAVPGPLGVGVEGDVARALWPGDTRDGGRRSGSLKTERE